MTPKQLADAIVNTATRRILAGRTRLGSFSPGIRMRIPDWELLSSILHPDGNVTGDYRYYDEGIHPMVAIQRVMEWEQKNDGANR